MRISEQVKFQIMTDVQETLSRLCQKYNMPNLKITENNKLLTEQFNKAFEEGFILSLKEPEKSELMGNPAHLQVKMVMKKKEFFQDLQNNIFKKQYITKIGKNATFSADKFGDLINYLLNTCIAEGIDQKIDQRLDDVLIDFFGENQLTDEVINIMRNHKIIAAQNIKANSNPAINSEQRQKVWSTEISKMLSAILLSIKTLSLEANKDYKSILNKAYKKLKMPVAFSPAKKWKAWDKETGERLDPLTEDIQASTNKLMNTTHDELFDDISNAFNNARKGRR